MATHFIILRVLQSEQLTDEDLLSFGLCGAKIYSQKNALKNENISGLDWISSEMWNDVIYLSQLEPFIKKGLVQHINS